ncbi:hypothetical protein [Streptomyces phaeochromogenes]|uniref:hypothetical protein n=1 Tax=Streptomyces phaeochromogenes TaxID=1923 RepID=UPI00371460AD
MHLRIRTAATLAVAASFIGLVGLAPPVSASQTPQTPEGKYCTVVVEPVKPGEKVSRVKSRTCTDDRATAAAARNSARTPLMSWYEHANYGGGSTMVFGDYGPCDLSGYVLNTGLWSRSISSFRTFSSCDGQQATLNDGDGPYLYWGYDTPYVGDFANDDIYSFWVYNLP